MHKMSGQVVRVRYSTAVQYKNIHNKMRGKEKKKVFKNTININIINIIFYKCRTLGILMLGLLMS